MKKTRYALYLAGYVDSVGNVADPIFIRELKSMPTSAEIPKNCMAVTEKFDGRYWSSEEDVYADFHEGWWKGDFCSVVYYDQNSHNNIKDFICELTQGIQPGGNQEYVSGIIYSNDLKRLGHPHDICVADVSDIY